MAFRLVPIVEGHGEESAVPIVLRRIVAELDLAVGVEIRRPIRRPRSTLLRDGGIEAAIHFATIEMGNTGAVLVLLDSEGECPADLAPVLLARAKAARPDKQITLVLAHHEFEAWFLASASSLAGRCRLSEDIGDHSDPENVQGCKEWIEQWMPATSRYSETADQPAMASVFDLALARRASSFDKFYREVELVCRQAKSLLENELPVS